MLSWPSINAVSFEPMIIAQVLIQLGDIVDRGEDDIAILSLLRSLDIQARAQGGAVFQVCSVRKWKQFPNCDVKILSYCMVLVEYNNSCYNSMPKISILH